MGLGVGFWGAGVLRDLRAEIRREKELGSHGVGNVKARYSSGNQRTIGVVAPRLQKEGNLEDSNPVPPWGECRELCDLYVVYVCTFVYVV